ncbi:hypothetical protein AAFF_G00193510 [Aldrovandia affinis]|uniref:Uncharacterized protein n=1 Tax=Aldrovandia affinis TaxID=143900 RepID=A0AAD7SX78_9TELE|nr:hypothetical protein AAFF_G00193510 [Aldrovandia affinis]
MTKIYLIVSTHRRSCGQSAKQMEAEILSSQTRTRIKGQDSRITGSGLADRMQTAAQSPHVFTRRIGAGAMS